MSIMTMLTFIIAIDDKTVSRCIENYLRSRDIVSYHAIALRFAENSCSSFSRENEMRSGILYAGDIRRDCCHHFVSDAVNEFAKQKGL